MRGLGMFDPPLSLRTATRKPTAVYQFWWEARRDEPGREGTLQHAGQIKLCNSDCNQDRAVIWSFGQLVTTPASQSAWWQAPACRSPNPGGSGRLDDPPVSPRTNARAISRLRPRITDRGCARRPWQVR